MIWVGSLDLVSGFLISDSSTENVSFFFSWNQENNNSRTFQISQFVMILPFKSSVIDQLLVRRHWGEITRLVERVTKLFVEWDKKLRLGNQSINRSPQRLPLIQA